MTDEVPDRPVVPNPPSDQPARRTAEFWKFFDEWDKRVLIAIVLVVAGVVVFAISSSFSVPIALWIPPALIVAFSPIVFVLSRRFLQGTDGDAALPGRAHGSASILYSTTVVAEVLQFISLPCVVYWLGQWASADAGERQAAALTGWWLAAYGTMQMAKRVGLSTLTIAMFSTQALKMDTLQERIAQLEKRLSAASGEPS